MVFRQVEKDLRNSLPRSFSLQFSLFGLQAISLSSVVDLNIIINDPACIGIDIVWVFRHADIEFHIKLLHAIIIILVYLDVGSVCFWNSRMIQGCLKSLFLCDSAACCLAGCRCVGFIFLIVLFSSSFICNFLWSYFVLTIVFLCCDVILTKRITDLLGKAESAVSQWGKGGLSSPFPHAEYYGTEIYIYKRFSVSIWNGNKPRFSVSKIRRGPKRKLLHQRAQQLPHPSIYCCSFDLLLFCSS